MGRNVGRRMEAGMPFVEGGSACLRKPGRLSTSTWADNRYLWLAVLAMTAHAAITLWRLRNSYFFADDFLELELAHATPLSIRHLTRDMFGHVEPLTMLTHWVFIRLAGLNFELARLTLITLSTATVGVLAAIALRARTPPAIAVACVMAAALSWVTIEPDRWWSSGVIVTTSTLLVSVALWICAKPSPRLKLSERVLLAAVVLGACAFYNKAVCILALCGAIRLFVASNPAFATPRSSLLRNICSAFADILPAAIGVGAFMALVFSVKLSTPMEPTRVVVGDVVKALAIGVQYGWFGGGVGLRLGDPPTRAGFLVTAAIIDSVAAFVVLASLRCNPRALWLWAGLIASIGVGLALIAVQRTAQFGVMMMAIGRYHTDGVFVTWAVVAIMFGRAFRQAPATKGAKALDYAIPIGALVVIFQLIGASRYPEIWDTQGNRRFIERLERSAAALSPGQSVGDRPVPERITPRWMQPWNDLSSLAAVLPRPLRTTGWDRATHYMDDDGQLTAFAAAPRRRFTNVDGSDLVLSMAPPFEYVGFLQRTPSDRAVGWFNPRLAPPEKVRIAIVSHDRILAWADRQDRPDVGAAFNRPDMAASGFTAPVPATVSHQALSAVAVIDNRIGVTLPIG